VVSSSGLLYKRISSEEKEQLKRNVEFFYKPFVVTAQDKTTILSECFLYLLSFDAI